MSHGSVLHIPPTNLLLLAAKQDPYKKACLFTKNIEEFSGKSSEKWTSRQKKRIRQRGNSKVESNDSPEIPDRGQTSDIPSLTSWWAEEDIKRCIVERAN